MLNQGSLIFPHHLEPAAWRPPLELPSLSNVKRLSLDQESTGKNPFKDKSIGISIAFRVNEGGEGIRRYYLPWGHSGGNLDEAAVKRWARTELRGKEIVFSSAKYDIHELKNSGIDLEALDVKPFDIAFNGALLDDSRRAALGLDPLGRKYVGRGKLPFSGNIDRMVEHHSSEVGLYAEEDAGLTLEVDETTWPFLVAEGLERVHKLENDIIYFVCEIERNGCRMDVPKLEQWRKEIQAQVEACIYGLQKTTGIMVELGSGDSIRELFKMYGLTPPIRKKKRVKAWEKKKKEGKLAYTEEELLAYRHPVMNEIVRGRQLQSLLSRFLTKWHDALRGGEVLRSQYHQLKFTGNDEDEDDLGSVAGRFSSSGSKHTEGYSFNAQQTIKPELQIETLGDHHIVRELFIPEDGMEYGACDASQIEYRIFAHFSNSPSIVKAYMEDAEADFHDLVMQKLKVMRPNITRSTTKRVNFGKLYRAQPPTLAATAGISVREAETLYAELDKIFPEAERFSVQVEREAIKNGFVSTIMGRRARLTDEFHAATNRVIQGSAADIMKLKLARIYRERKTIGITRLRQTVHDEQCFDLDPDPKYKALISECFNVQEVALRVPITWNFVVGRNWRECH